MSCVTCEPKSRIRILSWFMDACGRGRADRAEAKGGVHPQRWTGRTERRLSPGPSGLQTVVRRLFGDADVVHVRLAHAGRRDLDELRLGAHLVDRAAAA